MFGKLILIVDLNAAVATHPLAVDARQRRASPKLASRDEKFDNRVSPKGE